MTEEALREIIDECAAIARRAAFVSALHPHEPWETLADRHKLYWRRIVAPVIDHVRKNIAEGRIS